jgi:hypothetical protein
MRIVEKEAYTMPGKRIKWTEDKIDFIIEKYIN